MENKEVQRVKDNGNWKEIESHPKQKAWKHL